MFGYTIDGFDKLFLYDLWDLTIDEIDEWIKKILTTTSCGETEITSVTKTRSKI